MDMPDADLFAALRADLLRGDLGNLAAHLAALTELESRVSVLGDAAVLAALRAEADRNRDILAAAAAGVRAALRRLGEAGAPAAVYAPDGRRQPLGTPAPASESRA
jgi:hypothetical protein